VYYYGYRYYSNELGRWLSRDPKKESGGLNLYVFVRNAGINDWDVLGLVYNIDFDSFDWKKSKWNDEPSDWRIYDSGIKRYRTITGTRTGIGWAHWDAYGEFYGALVSTYAWAGAGDGCCCWKESWVNYPEIGFKVEQDFYKHQVQTRTPLNVALDRSRQTLEVMSIIASLGSTYLVKKGLIKASRFLVEATASQALTTGTKIGATHLLSGRVMGGWVESNELSDTSYHRVVDHGVVKQNIHLHYHNSYKREYIDKERCLELKESAAEELRNKVPTTLDYPVGSSRCHGADNSKGGCPL